MKKNGKISVALIENWKALHGLAGARYGKLADMQNVIEEQLAVQSPIATEEMITKNGFKNPCSFFQSFLIRGWYSKKV